MDQSTDYPIDEPEVIPTPIFQNESSDIDELIENELRTLSPIYEPVQSSLIQRWNALLVEMRDHINNPNYNYNDRATVQVLIREMDSNMTVSSALGEILPILRDYITQLPTLTPILRDTILGYVSYLLDRSC